MLAALVCIHQPVGAPRQRFQGLARLGGDPAERQAKRRVAVELIVELRELADVRQRKGGFAFVGPGQRQRELVSADPRRKERPIDGENLADAAQQVVAGAMAELVIASSITL